MVNGNETWLVACRLRQLEAEARVNLVRVVMIAVLYAIYLLHFAGTQRVANWLVTLQLDRGPRFSNAAHGAVTTIATAWMVGALLTHGLLLQRIFPRWLMFATTAVDLVLLTLLLGMIVGPTSPLTTGYFLIIIMSSLRLDLLLVRSATAGAILGYLIVNGCVRWPWGWVREQHLVGVPRYHQWIMMAALLFAGVLVGQGIRHLHRTLRDAGWDLPRGDGR